MSRKGPKRKRRFTPGDGKAFVFTSLAVGLGVLLAWMAHRGHPHGAPAGLAAAAVADDSGWTVGELRSNGLRIVPSGRSDAADVLDHSTFDDPEVRHAYRIATEIPEILNQLYCWCGCENRGVHRSSLGCFEDEMAVNCDVCRGTAEIAWERVNAGVTDAGEIQSAVDAKWAPAGARGA